MNEERQRYGIPPNLRTHWRDLPAMPGVTRERNTFVATRSDAFKVLLALDRARQAPIEEHRKASIPRMHRARAEAMAARKKAA